MNDQIESASSRRGKSSRRPQRLTAALLSFITPGLGLIYVGKLLAGLFVNIFFVLLVLLFIIAVNLWKFFPLYPALVLVATWLVLCGLCAWRSLEIIAQEEATDQRGYHHPLAYIAIALLTFAAPLSITTHFTSRHLFSVATVDSLVMYPQAQPGDHLLIDRTIYRDVAPQRGDLVAIRIPDTGELAVLRIVGVPDDHIEMLGHTLVINDNPLDFSPMDPRWVENADVDEDSELLIWVEHNHDRQYVVSMIPGLPRESTIPNLKLADETYFVLADNRSLLGEQTRVSADVDSRYFGPISRDHIEGRPLYIAWSYNPTTGSPRWNRIGLPTE